MTSRRRNENDELFDEGSGGSYDDDDSYVGDQHDDGSYSQSSYSSQGSRSQSSASYSQGSGSYSSDEQEQQKQRSKQAQQEDPQTPSARSEDDDDDHDDVSHSAGSGSYSNTSQQEEDEPTPAAADAAFDTNPDFGVTADFNDNGFGNNDAFGFGDGDDSSSSNNNKAFDTTADADFAPTSFGYDEKGFGGGADGFGFDDKAPASPLANGNGGFDTNEDEPSDGGDFSGREEDDYSGRDESSRSGGDQSGSYGHNDGGEDQSYSDRDQSYSGRDPSDHPEDYSDNKDHQSFSNRDHSGRGSQQSYSGREEDYSGGPEHQNQPLDGDEDYSGRDNSFSEKDNSARDEDYSGRDNSFSGKDYSDRGEDVSGREDDMSGRDYSGPEDLSGHDQSDKGDDFSGQDHSEREGDYSGRDNSNSVNQDDDNSDSRLGNTKVLWEKGPNHRYVKNGVAGKRQSNDKAAKTGGSDNFDNQDGSEGPEFDIGNEAADGSYSGHQNDYSGRDNYDDQDGSDAPEFDAAGFDNAAEYYEQDGSDAPELDAGDFGDGNEQPNDYNEGGEDSQRSYSQNEDSRKFGISAQDDFIGSNGGEDEPETTVAFQEGFADGADFGSDTRPLKADDMTGSQNDEDSRSDPSGSQEGDEQNDGIQDAFGKGDDFAFDAKASAPEDDAPLDGFDGGFGDGDLGFDSKASTDGFQEGFAEYGSFGFSGDGNDRPEGFEDFDGFGDDQFGANEDPVKEEQTQEDLSGSDVPDEDNSYYDDDPSHASGTAGEAHGDASIDADNVDEHSERDQEADDGNDSYYSGSGRRDQPDEDESIVDSAYQTADVPFDGADTLADTLDENTGHTMRLGFESQTNLDFKEGDFEGSISELQQDVEGAMNDAASPEDGADGLPPEEPTLREKLASRPGRVTNYNRYSREQMMKLTAQNADGKKKSKRKKAPELIDFVTDVNEAMLYLDEMLESGETEPDADSHVLVHGFECLVGIFLQLSDELDVMSTFAKTADKAATDALTSLLKFALPVNEIFAQLRPVIEHYFTHETDEEMNDLLYGMNLMVDLLCDLSHKVGEKQEWNQRACTAYATLVELLARDTLEVVSIYDDVDTPEYELSVEIEDAWNGTGHIEEFQTLEEAPDLAIFRQICYEVILSTDKWCPDIETLMNICGIEDVMLDEASQVDDVDDSALAVTPESAVQVLDKINGEALRRPALLASVLRRVLPGQKITDKSLAEHLSSIRSAMRSPLGLPASNLIGITSIPEVASDPNALGVAGVGKTTLAALVADHRDVRRHFVDGIAWVHLGQKELNYTRYIQCLRDLISQLEVAEEEEPAFPELLRTPGETGSQRRRREEGFLVFVRETMIAFLKKRAVLVILDDVCFESDLDWFDFGAPSDNPEDEVSSCVTLVTTRRRNLLPAADMVEVDMMEEDEAASLLVRESGDLARSLKAESTETRSVVRECANHPLAVKSVGRWLNLKHATSGESGDPEQLHKEVVQSMERILKNGADDDADMMYEILNMSLSPAINGEPTSIIKFCFAAYVHVFCDKEFISEFALADATPIVPLGTVEMLFEAILGLEEETLMKDGSLFFAQKKDAAMLIPTALSSLGVFKVIATIAEADEEDEEKTAGNTKEEKYLQIMHVVQQEYGEYLLDQDISLRDLGVDAEKRWNKAIAKAYLATKPEWDSDTPDASLDYFLEMMPVHLIRGEMLKDVASLLCNPSFVKGRLFALGRENGTRRHIKDCETLYDLLMKKKASTRKKYEPKATMRNAYETLGDHLNMDEDEYIKEEGSPEAVEVGRCQFEIGFSLAEKRCWEAAIEHWEASQEILVSALGMVEVVAGILYNIGVVYTEMNEYEQALGSLKQCLRVRGTIHGEDHILYAQTIQRIGDVFLSMSDYHEAMESYNWALDVMHIEPSHHRIDIGDILENMGRIHFYKGESDDALQCFQDALQSKQTELGEDHPELSSIYEHIGNCLSEQGKVEDAIAHLEEAIRLKQLDQFGGDETEAAVMTLQGVLSVRQGKQKAGLECYEKAIQLLVTKCPHRKEKIASLLHLIASVYLVSGENKKAMKLFEESLQARRKVLGFVHLDVASTLFSMAYLHQKRKRLDKALKCLEEALKIRQLRLPDSEKVAVTHEKIGTIARSIGKLKKAENAFSEALRIRKLIHGDNHPAVAKVMQDLGDLMDDLGEYEEAMKNYREAYRIRKSFGGDTLPVAETLYTIGFTYSNSGHYEKALECLDAALKIQRMHNGDDSPDCGDTLNMIGFLKAKCGQVDEAQECLRDALRIRKLQGDAIKISETLKNIGNAHRSKQEYRSAMETYQECLRIRQKELGREHDKVADALVAIGNIFADLSRPKEAMDAYQEALGIRARLFGDLDASLAPILQAMGMLDFYGNNYDRSLQLLNDYISIRNGNKGARDGDYVNVLFTIGNIYQLRHDEEQAKKAWTEAYETFKDLGLAESNPEHAEQMEKLMRDHGLGAVVQESNQDDFPEEPVRHKKGVSVLKLLKQKVKRGDGQNGMRRRKEKGQRL